MVTAAELTARSTYQQVILLLDSMYKRNRVHGIPGYLAEGMDRKSREDVSSLSTQTVLSSTNVLAENSISDELRYDLL
jgi:hypothetical protein